MARETTYPNRILQRVMSIPLEGATLRVNELLDLLRRTVNHLRETDIEIADCTLHDVRFQFCKDGIKVTAEFNR